MFKKSPPLLEVVGKVSAGSAELPRIGRNEAVSGRDGSSGAGNCRCRSDGRKDKTGRSPGDDSRGRCPRSACGGQGEVKSEEGQVVVEKGRRIGPQEIAVLALFRLFRSGDLATPEGSHYFNRERTGRDRRNSLVLGKLGTPMPTCSGLSVRSWNLTAPDRTDCKGRAPRGPRSDPAGSWPGTGGALGRCFHGRVRLRPSGAGRRRRRDPVS